MLIASDWWTASHVKSKYFISCGFVQTSEYDCDFYFAIMFLCVVYHSFGSSSWYYHSNHVIDVYKLFRMSIICMVFQVVCVVNRDPTALNLLPLFGSRDKTYFTCFSQVFISRYNIDFLGCPSLARIWKFLVMYSDLHIQPFNSSFVSDFLMADTFEWLWHYLSEFYNKYLPYTARL